MKAAAKDTRFHILWHHIPIHEAMKIFREADQEKQKKYWAQRLQKLFVSIGLI
jgi:hypothetical protein